MIKERLRTLSHWHLSKDTGKHIDLPKKKQRENQKHTHYVSSVIY